MMLLLLFVSCVQNDKEKGALSLQKISVDTMSLANPFVLYDKIDDLYYMTGDGGELWRSSDMRCWEGPLNVLSLAEDSWMGEAPVITSPEIHPYEGRYYYMATFTCPDEFVAGRSGRRLERTSCEIFVGDEITGPYEHVTLVDTLLDPKEYSVHPTFCIDENNVGYMIYNHSALQNDDATVQIVRLGKQLVGRVGEPYVIFRASQNPWSSDTQGRASSFMEAPFYFETLTGRRGILFTTVAGGEKAVGVAYTGDDAIGLDGPWRIDNEPLLTAGAGNAMLFKDYDGRTIMAYNKDTLVNGKIKHQLRFMRVDTQFDKLKIKEHYKF